MHKHIRLLFLVVIFTPSKLDSQWVQTNGPYGGQVKCFTMLGSSLFAGTYDGIFMSTNNGISWKKVGLVNYNISALTSIGSYLFASSVYYGVFLSINGGNSWTQINTGLSNKNVQALAVIGHNLFAGTDDGVFLSSNYGNYWNQINNGLTNKKIHCLSASGNNLFAGTDDGVFISSNNGSNWSPINNGIRKTTVYCIVVSGNNIFIATDSSGVLLSTNMGNNWQQTSLTNIDVRTLALNVNLLLAGTYGSGIFRSTNNGTSWTLSNSGLKNNYIFAFFIDGYNNIMTGTLDGIFLSSNNGVSWIDRSTGLTNTTINALVYTGTNLFAGTNNGIFFSSNNGTSWTEVGLNNQYVLSLAVYGSNIIAGSNGVYMSTDNGITWASRGLDYYDVYSIEIIYPRIFASTSSYVSRSSFFSTSWESILHLPVHVNTTLTKKDTVLFLGTTIGIYYSPNFGTAWEKIGFMQLVRTVAISDTFIFAGTGDAVYRKGFKETNWQKMIFPEGIRINNFAVSGKRLFAGTSNGIFLSENNGISWIDVSTGLTNKEIQYLTIGSHNLFAGTYAGGVWRRPLSEMITSIYSLDNEIKMDFKLYQNYPNPFNPSTTIRFEIPKESHVTLKVYNILGQEVATLVDEVKKLGRYEVKWNPSASSGQVLASGVYFYCLQAIPTNGGQAGTYSSTRKLVIIQ